MPEFDSPWKEALDGLLEPFLMMFAPALALRIDWAVLPEALDGELARLFPDAVAGKRIVDRLYKVLLRDGNSLWILIHIEVQAQREDDFTERVFRYFYRLRDKFDLPLTCIAVLADDSPSWRPAEYVYEFEGTRLHFAFPAIKLLDYRHRIAELETSDNPFSLIVLAHLQTQSLRDNDSRLDWKRRITHNLLQRTLDEDRRAKVLRLVDWLIDLPVEWNDVYWDEVRDWKERNIMPFVSIFEKKAQEEGMRQGLEQGLERGLEKGLEKGRREELLAGLEVALDLKFNEAGRNLFQELLRVADLDKLKAVQRAIKSSASPDELRRYL